MDRVPLRSVTDQMSLAEVTGRLAGHPAINALLYIGSTGRSHFNTHSDFDLLIVCSIQPLPAEYIITTIDGRFSDLILVNPKAVESLPGDGTSTALIHWLQSGTIAFDKSDLLAKAQTRLAGYSNAPDANTSHHLDHLIRINYNLRQNERMLKYEDPVYQDALEMRLLYGISEIVMAYFALRQLPWHGEKEAVRHLLRHDRRFLDMFQQTVRTITLGEKIRLYRKLAELALAPAGPLWPDEASHISRSVPISQSELLTGWDWWVQLIEPGTD